MSAAGAGDPAGGPAGGAGPQGPGRWLFQNRGWLPAPLVAAMILSPDLSGWGPPPWAIWPGAALIALGEGLRLWAVGHIGRRSRTRGGDVGGLVAAGPYARVRNPLYIGNVLIFAGVGAIRWPWALVVVPLLCLHYRWIVAWEEQNLSAQIGRPYLDYLARVPRWWPARSGIAPDPGAWSGREALRSERGTFAVLAVVLAALALRAQIA